MSLTDAQRDDVAAGRLVTIAYPVPDERRRSPLPEPPLRLAILDAQRVAPRGVGMPRRTSPWLGVVVTLGIVASTVLYGLAVYGALALWRAL